MLGKRISSLGLASIVSISASLCVSAADTKLDLVTTAEPVNWESSLHEDLYVIDNQLVYIDDEVLADFCETGSLDYKILVDDVDNYFDCVDYHQTTYRSGQYFRNGYANLANSDGNSMGKNFLVSFDGDSLNVIKEIESDYTAINSHSISCDGYIGSYERGDIFTTVTITAPNGKAVETELYSSTTPDILGYKFNSDKIYAFICEANVTYTGTDFDYYIADIDYNGNVNKTKTGRNAEFTSYYQGENFIYYATRDFNATTAESYLYFTDTHEIIKLDSAYLDYIQTATNTSMVGEIAIGLSGFDNHMFDNKLVTRYKRHTSEEYYIEAVLDLEKPGKIVGKPYKSISTNDGEIYLVQDFDGQWGYMDKKGKELAMFDDAGSFHGDYAPVVIDGTAYLIDRNMNIVSEGIKADSVMTYSEYLFKYKIGNDNYLMTYDRNVKTDNNDKESVETSEELPEIEETTEEAPVTDEPTEEAPITNESTEEQPIISETTEEPVINETTEDEPVAEETVEDRPAYDTPAVDTEAPTDTDKGGSPDTGANGIAAAAALSIVALGAVMLSRKNR